MNLEKKSNNLIHENEHLKIKCQFGQLKDSEKLYIAKSIELNSLQKNLYHSLFDNIIGKNKEDVVKNNKLKSVLLIALKNSLLKKNLYEIRKKETKTAITFINEKYNLNLGIPKYSYIDDESSNKESKEFVDDKSNIY